MEGVTAEGNGVSLGSDDYVLKWDVVMNAHSFINGLKPSEVYTFSG